MLQLHVARAGEEVLIFWIRPRPAALNVIDPQFVQLLDHQDFVVGREADGFALSAVAQRGVEREDAHKSYVAAGTPTSFFFLRKVIILRSSAPTFSMGWFSCSARIARNFLRPVLFSSIHSR